VVQESNVAAYCDAFSARVAVTTNESFAVVQPLTVDSVVSLIFPCLLSGGVLHLISSEAALDPRSMADYFRRNSIDYLKMAPSHLDAIHDDPLGFHVLPRKALIVGGEASRHDWTVSIARRGGCKVFNHYGPTETTVGVTMHEVLPDPRNPDRPITPIGSAIGGTELWIVDRQLRQVVPGEPGELLVGGEFVARGYLNEPALTASGFIPNPFGSGRVYRTGDIVREPTAGCLEFVGREDDQVKVRGFRVELGEVRAAIARVPGIRDAVVLPEPGGQSLMALVVARHGTTLDPASVIEQLREMLPGHMVPTGVEIRDSLPRLPHGKVDLQSLC
jgi:non-ribosomal peptide synthetase component F